MANSSFVVTDTPKPVSDLSLRTSTANRLGYLYKISHVPEDSKIPITNFPIVNPYTVFNKPQPSFKKIIKKIIGPSHSSTIKKYMSRLPSLINSISQQVKMKISLPLLFLESL